MSIHFQNSEHPIYKQMWSFMSSNEAASFVNNSAEGFQRALNQDFAYLAESATIDYKVQRLCKLTQIGGLLDSKGFGLATPKGNTFSILDDTILSAKLIEFLCW